MTVVASVHPLPLIGALALLVAVFLKRRDLGRLWSAVGLLICTGLVVYGLGLVELPDLEQLIEDIGSALGPWTYLLVGAMAFLETGAFIGLIAPGETTVLVGGVVAGQGEIDLIVLIGIVWAAAVAGDTTSYALGRRYGRKFVLDHGQRLKITEERLQSVEGFFDRYGGLTILIGRFIGLLRALAPFIAGASKMPLRVFLPFDILGAGIWATVLCLLGYFFWRSLDEVSKYLSQGFLAFGLLVGVVVMIIVARRVARDEEAKARMKQQVNDLADKPVIAPVVRFFAPLWRPAPARFVVDRFTPGQLGLEFTTLLAIAAVTSYLFVAFGIAVSNMRDFVIDDQAERIADAIRVGWGVSVAKVLTALGAIPVVTVLVLATAGFALTRRRLIDAVALVGGLVLTYLSVVIAKDVFDRPRPSDSLVEVNGFAYPSGHAAYSIALIACAIVITRSGISLIGRISIVALAAGLAIAVMATRVYLRAHYLSDVIGGACLGLCVFSIVGIAALVATYLSDRKRSTNE